MAKPTKTTPTSLRHLTALHPRLFNLPLDVLDHQGHPIHRETRDAIVPSARGAIFTRRWVVDLILDLAGYTPDRDLVEALAIEPSCGDGVFVTAMAERLITSCRRQGRPLLECARSLIAFDVDPRAVRQATEMVLATLKGIEVPYDEACQLVARWIRTGDYLCQSPTLPPADFVLGNPPYVRIEDVPQHQMAIYRLAYSTMRGRADLYVGFFEAALRGLKPDGVCAFICADRWMRNQYGGELRRLITGGDFWVDLILEMHQAAAFEDEVSAYPAITVVRRSPSQLPTTVAQWTGEREPSDSTAFLKALHPTFPVPQTASAEISDLSVSRIEPWFCGDEPWPQGSPKQLEMLRYLEANFPSLESLETGTKVGIGVATGADRVYIIDRPASDATDQPIVEPACLLPLAMAGDLKDDSATVTSTAHFLVNPWPALEGGGLIRFPKLQAYLRPHELTLRSRYVGKKDPARWYKTIDRVDASLTARPKLYLPDIKDRIAPVLDTGTTYPHHNLYVITSDKWDLEVLGGLLLSDIAQLFVESYSVKIRGGYLRFQAQYLRRIRIPHMESITDADQAELVAVFRARDSHKATQIATRLYGLNLTEVPT